MDTLLLGHDTKRTDAVSGGRKAAANTTDDVVAERHISFSGSDFLPLPASPDPGCVRVSSADWTDSDPVRQQHRSGTVIVMQLGHRFRIPASLQSLERPGTKQQATNARAIGGTAEVRQVRARLQPVVHPPKATDEAVGDSWSVRHRKVKSANPNRSRPGAMPWAAVKRPTARPGISRMRMAMSIHRSACRRSGRRRPARTPSMRGCHRGCAALRSDGGAAGVRQGPWSVRDGTPSPTAIRARAAPAPAPPRAGSGACAPSRTSVAKATSPASRPTAMRTRSCGSVSRVGSNSSQRPPRKASNTAWKSGGGVVEARIADRQPRRDVQRAAERDAQVREVAAHASALQEHVAGRRGGVGGADAVLHVVVDPVAHRLYARVAGFEVAEHACNAAEPRRSASQ